LRCAKGAIDSLAASVLLFPLLPFLALLALPVWKKLGSPIIFRQERPGFHEKPFNTCGFRSLREDREDDGRATRYEGRLTPFGRRLRSGSPDELPEIFNVLKRGMAFVGSRPMLTICLDRYSLQEMRRHELRLGITGWAQVHERNATTWGDRLARDIWYVDHASFLLDCRSIWMTLKTMRGKPSKMVGDLEMEEFTGESTRPVRSKPQLV
jgi:sugar transferase EpsL